MTAMTNKLNKSKRLKLLKRQVINLSSTGIPFFVTLNINKEKNINWTKVFSKKSVQMLKKKCQNNKCYYQVEKITQVHTFI